MISMEVIGVCMLSAPIPFLASPSITFCLIYLFCVTQDPPFCVQCLVRSEFQTHFSLVTCAVTMANRKSARSSVDDDRDQHLQLLRQLQDSGQLASLMDELQGPLSTGAMHDGCKRRLDDSWLEIRETEGEVGIQGPVLPKQSSSTEVALPEGVASLTQWGKTLITLPKYAKLQLSYDQMVKKAAADLEKGDTELHKCLAWVFNYTSTQSLKTLDFAKYLQAIKWGDKTQTGPYFPGSQEVRRFV